MYSILDQNCTPFCTRLQNFIKLLYCTYLQNSTHLQKYTYLLVELYSLVEIYILTCRTLLTCRNIHTSLQNSTHFQKYTYELVELYTHLQKYTYQLVELYSLVEIYILACRTVLNYMQNCTNSQSHLFNCTHWQNCTHLQNCALVLLHVALVHVHTLIVQQVNKAPKHLPPCNLTLLSRTPCTNCCLPNFIGFSHRIINDRMEKAVKVQRFMNNLLQRRGCARISQPRGD